MSKYAFAAAAALSALIASSAAMAQSAQASTDQFKVTVKVEKSCTFDASGDVNFNGVTGSAPNTGVKGSSLSSATVDKTITATCTNGTPYGLYFTSPNSADGKFFMKADDASSTEKIPYTMNFKSFSSPSALTTDAEVTAGAAVITGLGPTSAFLGNGEEQTITLKLAIGKLAKLPTPGGYTDTVTVAINF